MILNMPVTNGAITSVPSQSQSEFCDFLKRKYPDNDISHLPPHNPSPSTNYQGNNNSNNSNAWKKRHIEEANFEVPVSSPSSASYNNHNSSPVEEYQPHSGSAAQSNIPTTDTATSTGTFNLIANSTSFINDLFTYDANLLVPVSSSNSLVESVLGPTEPTFTTPSNICVNSTHQFEEDNADNWQASDLLELDHRYNSSLQTEITHLNPTVSLKPHEETLVKLAAENNGQSTTTPSTHPIAEENQFLQPQKSPSTKSLHTPHTMDSEADFEDKNLSWLLNFKFDEFPHLNPDVAGANSKSLKSQQNNGYSSAGKSASGSPQNVNSANGSLGGRERSKSPKNSHKTGKKFEELVMEVTSEMDGSDMVIAENVVIEDTPSTHRAPKKPPFTYTELIEYALEDKGELTVSGIYQWISDRFPYYKSNDDRWKNSVRHNLSINPHFRKGHKAPQGAGHLWTISSGDSAENVLAWEHKKQRLDLFFKMEAMNRERLNQHQQQLQQQTANTNVIQQQQQHNKQRDRCGLYDEAAVAAAAIQQEMMQQQGHCGKDDVTIQHRNAMHSNNAPSHHQRTLHDLPYNELMSDEELRKTAGQILNGIHREVEVQSVNQQPSIISTYQDVLLDNEDYLNPVHKDIAVNESGLRHISATIDTSNTTTHCHSTSTHYYVTEIDPLELGIQMTSHPHPLAHSHVHNNNNINNHHHHQHHHHQQHHGHNPTTTTPAAVKCDEANVALFNDEFNLNYFTYNPATDIVA